MTEPKKIDDDDPPKPRSRLWTCSKEPEDLTLTGGVIGIEVPPPRNIIECAKRLVREYKKEKKIRHPVEIWWPNRPAASGEIETVAGIKIEFPGDEYAWVFFVNLCPIDSEHRSCVYVVIDTLQGNHVCSVDARTRPSEKPGHVKFGRDEEFWGQQGGSSSK